MSKQKHYLVYQITDNLNMKIYIGVHVTLNVNDGYMGSGVALQKAFKEFGIKNFSKTILYDFTNKEKMLNKEAELVNESFIKREDTYNIILGGGFNTTGLTTARDKNGQCFLTNVNDPRFKSGEIESITKGFVQVKDKNGNIFRVSKKDKRYLSGELVFIATGFISVKDKNGKTFQISKDDSKYLSGEFVHHTKNTISIKDKNENCFRVDLNDPRYLSGELVGIAKGYKFTDDQILKQINARANGTFQKGERNSQYGTCWITNEKANKKIHKGDLIPNGWRLGRKQIKN